MYNVNLESLNGGKKHLRHSEYTIYTDRSKKQEGTGGGFVVYNYNKQIHTQSFKMQTHATVYQAELEAIYQACKYMDAAAYQLGNTSSRTITEVKQR